jgi:sulfite reductase alpha subunit-like flavoprotein
MQLDDFLELERCRWTRLVVIIASSYGVGQAPLGGYRFRDLCDAWLLERSQKAEGGEADAAVNRGRVLDGVRYALCGLGDSKYTTFFKNPTVIDSALQAAGAVRVGELGKADASGVGDAAQSVVIERWIDGIWTQLARTVVQEPLSPTRMKEMQDETVEICSRINPEFPRPNTATRGTVNGSVAAIWAIVVAFAAVIGYYIYSL